MQQPTLKILDEPAGETVSAETGTITLGPAAEAALEISDIFHGKRPSPEGRELMMAMAAPASPQGHGLIPPRGARFGTAGMTAGGTVTLVPGTATKYQQANQTAGVSLTNTFYVYNANGEGRNDYFVILVQTGSFSPGDLVMAGNHLKGLEQYEVSLGNRIARPNGAAYGPDVVTLVTSSPQATSKDPASTIASQEMNLLVSGGGDELVPDLFKAQLNPESDAGAVNSLTNWAVDSTGNPVEHGSGWDYFQTALWNPHTDPPKSFKTWYGQMYDHGNVKALPAALSTSTLHTMTVSVWKLDQSLVENNQLPVVFSGTATTAYAGFIAPDGSVDGHHYINTLKQTFEWRFPVDLVAIVDPTPESFWVGLDLHASTPYLLAQLSSGSWRPPKLLKSGPYDPPPLAAMAFGPGLEGEHELIGLSKDGDSASLFMRGPEGQWTTDPFQSLLSGPGREAFVKAAEGGFSRVVKKTSPDGGENVIVFLSTDGTLYAASQTRSAKIWHFEPQAIPSAATLKSIAIGVGNDNYMQVVGIDADGGLYLSWRDGGGHWHSAGKLSAIASGKGMDIPFSQIAMGQGSQGDLQLIGLASEDSRPRLFWQDRRTAHWNYAGAFSQFIPGDGAKIALSQVVAAPGNGGNLQVVGLREGDGTPYLFWQDHQNGQWHFAGNLYAAAGFTGRQSLFSDLALGTAAETGTSDLQLIGLGYGTGVAYLFEQNAGSGKWTFAGSLYPTTTEERAFSQVAG